MDRIYCNKCKKEITSEPHLAVCVDWHGTRYMERYEPEDRIHLCVEHAEEFLAETIDEVSVKKWEERKRNPVSY